MSISDIPVYVIPTPAQRRYIATETSIAVPVAAAFSVGFVFALFAGQNPVMVWGQGGLAFDTVPHTLGVLAPAVVVPTLITRHRLRSGKMAGLARHPAWVPRHLLLRTLFLSALGLLVGGGSFLLLLSLSKRQAFSFVAVLFLKALYGALLVLAATPTVIRAALADANPSSPGTKDRS